MAYRNTRGLSYDRVELANPVAARAASQASSWGTLFGRIVLGSIIAIGVVMGGLALGFGVAGWKHANDIANQLDDLENDSFCFICLANNTVQFANLIVGNANVPGSIRFYGSSILEKITASSITVKSKVEAADVIVMNPTGGPAIHVGAQIADINAEISVINSELVDTCPCAEVQTMIDQSLDPIYSELDLLEVAIANITVQGNFTILYNELVSINNSLAVVTAQVDSLDTTVTFLSAEINTLNNSMSTLTSDVTTINNTVNSFNNQILYFNSTITYLNNQVTTINTTLNNLVAQVTAVNNSVSTLTQDVSALNNTVTLLNNQIMYFNATITSLNNTVNSLVTQISTFNSSITQLNNNFATLNATVTQLSTSVDVLNTTVTLCCDTVNSLNSTINSLNATVKQLTDDVQLLNTTMTDVVLQVNNLTALYNQVRSELAAIETNITIIQSQIVSIETQLTNNVTLLQSEIDALQTQLAGNITILSNQIVNAYDLIYNLQNITTNLNTTIIGIQADVTALFSTVSGLQTQITNVSNALTTLNASVVVLSGSLESLNASFITLNNFVNNVFYPQYLSFASAAAANISTLQLQYALLNSSFTTLNNFVNNVFYPSYLSFVSATSVNISSLQTSVASINSTLTYCCANRVSGLFAGQGIVVSGLTGNVTVSASNITQNTLLGRGSAGTGPTQQLAVDRYLTVNSTNVGVVTPASYCHVAGTVTNYVLSTTGATIPFVGGSINTSTCKFSGSTMLINEQGGFLMGYSFNMVNNDGQNDAEFTVICGTCGGAAVPDSSTSNGEGPARAALLFSNTPTGKTFIYENRASGQVQLTMIIQSIYINGSETLRMSGTWFAFKLYD